MQYRCLKRIQTEVASNPRASAAGGSVAAPSSQDVSQLSILADDHAAISERTQVLGGVEAEAANGSRRSGSLAPMTGSEGLRGILSLLLRAPAPSLQR